MSRALFGRWQPRTRTKLYAYNAQQAPAQDHCTTTLRPPHSFDACALANSARQLFTATLRSAAASSENSHFEATPTRTLTMLFERWFLQRSNKLQRTKTSL